MRDSEVGTLLTEFLYGIEYNVFSSGEAQHWAQVAQRGKLASVEIAKIANADTREDMLDALRNAIAQRYAMPEAELPPIGRMLFGYIADEFGGGKIEMRAAIHTAMQIADCTGQPNDAGEEFRRLSDAYFRFVEEIIAVLRSKSESPTLA